MPPKSHCIAIGLNQPVLGQPPKRLSGDEVGREANGNSSGFFDRLTGKIRSISHRSSRIIQSPTVSEIIQPDSSVRTNTSS